MRENETLRAGHERSKADAQRNEKLAGARAATRQFIMMLADDEMSVRDQ
jgi:hypothetical protein